MDKSCGFIHAEIIAEPLANIVKKILILNFLFIFSFLNAQTSDQESYKTEFDSILHKRIYRVEYGSIHTIELVEFKERTFKGRLVNKLTRYNRKSSKDFIQKISIPALLTQKLMNDFKALRIEELKGCGNIFSPEYNCVGALDGDGTRITVLSEIMNKKLAFQAISPGNKETKGYPKNQIVAQKILNVINREINLKKLLHQYMKHLPPGTYGYYGINMIELKR